MVDELKFSKLFDHTLLKPEASKQDILKLCQQAREHDFASVCVNSYWVPEAVQALKDSKVMTIAVVGFPLGMMSTAAKVYETRWCVEHGAEEIDMVLNHGAVRSGDHEQAALDINAITKAAQGRPVKVILETGYLSSDQIKQWTKVAAEQGASYVKTSTGFGPRGASVEDIITMRKTLDELNFKNVGVKASGGIRNLAFVNELVQAGANRIGASAGADIVLEKLGKTHKTTKKLPAPESQY
jgi:deoxyribose-phosphate aldolase